jgi:flagellar motor protein MotB
MTQKKNWFLRKNDGSEYGPVSLTDLLRWSAQCRLIAGNAVSTDREEWTPVESMPELRMDWIAHRADGKEYGPFALEAVKELFDHDVLPADAILVNRRTGENKPLAEVIAPGVAELDAQEDRSLEPVAHSSGDDSTLLPVLESVAAAEDSGTSGTEQSDAVSPETDDDVDVVPSGAESTEAPGAGAAVSARDAVEEVVLESAVRRQEERPRPARSKREPRSARQTVRPEQPELPGAIADPVPDPVATAAASTGDEEIIPSEPETRAGGMTGESISPSGDELAGAQAALQASLLQRQKEQDLFDSEAESLRQQIEALLHDLTEARNEAAMHAGQSDTLQEELDRARRAVRDAEARRVALEAKRSDNLQVPADDLAELRKQTAFMKKNIAVLHAELEAVRRVSQRRGKIILVLAVVLTLAAALAILRIASGGCQRSRPVAEFPLPPSGSVSGTGGDAGGGMAVSQGPRERVAPGVAGASAATTADARASAWPSIQIQGLRATPGGNSLAIRFEEGAFSSLTTLTPEATARLKTLAAQLRPLTDRYRIVVEGHTDDRPMRPTAGFADNKALASARAEAVAGFLRKEGGLPASAVTAAGTPGAPPYPNDTPENRRRNRTAVLKLVPR